MAREGIWTKDESAKHLEHVLQKYNTKEVHKASKTCTFSEE